MSDQKQRRSVDDEPQVDRGGFDREALLSVELHGSKITEDTVHEAGEALLGLCKEVSREAGGGVEWTLGTPRFKCDGCDREQPLDALREGWTHAEGDDFCPACSVSANDTVVEFRFALRRALRRVDLDTVREVIAAEIHAEKAPCV